MKRQIKFRAWDGNVMITPYCELMDGNRFWGEDLTNTGYNDPISVMQFTGLLDRNGREIHEADIVKWGHLEGYSRENPIRVATVKINPDIQFCIIDTPELNKDFGEKHHIFNYGSFAYTDTQSYLEVIGNVFETPELLNQTKT